VPRARINLSPHDAAGSAAQTAIHRHLEALLKHEPGAISGDVEAIHQVRVATRRLRAALQLFSPFLCAPKPETLRRELAWIASAAGAVRELDVSAEVARACAGKIHVDAGKNLEPLWRYLESRRRREHRKLAAELRSARYHKLVKELSGPFSINARGDAPLAAVAVDLARPIVRKMVAAGEKAEEKPVAVTLHRLRVSVKRSRYALEMLRPLGGRRLAKALERLEKMQEVLGSYHDSVVAAGVIEKWAREARLRPASALAAGALVESLRRREHKLGLRSIARWRKIDGRLMEREVVSALKGAATAPKKTKVVLD
jgi:CHAD domain-containing protein